MQKNDPYDLKGLKGRAKAGKKGYKQLYKRLHHYKGDVDALFADAHEKAFECIDCLKCANCCRTTGPLFTRTDIKRIAKHLNISPADFEQEYLQVDEDEDFVLQSLPCPFLNLETNKCGIYEVRPKACAEYPHTDMRGQLKKQQLTIKNASICPAVEEVLGSISTKTGNK